MVKMWKRVIAAAMALTILGGVSQIPVAYAHDNVPPPSMTVPGEVRKEFGVPNSINVQVKDENGNLLQGGKFELRNAANSAVARWDGGNNIIGVGRSYDLRERCYFKIKDCYETGDYEGSIRFPNGGTYINREDLISRPYGEMEEYVTYGGKMDGEESVTIPAGEVWINVDAGYKREAGQDKITQQVTYGKQSYDLSDLAGQITQLPWAAGTSQESDVRLDELGGFMYGLNKNILTSAGAAEEYRKIKVDFHACYGNYVNEKGQHECDDGVIHTYGAPIVKGDYVTSGYLQVTSGAVTNFISLDNGPVAEIYVKKGDYNPQVACNFAGKHNGGGNSGKIFICGYMKHVFSVTAPPKEGVTIGYIPAGTYTLHQVSAAEGYLPVPDRQIVVTDGKAPTDMQMIELVNKKIPAPHEHTFSPDWSKDEQNHWHAATCEHSDLVKDKTAHTYGDWKVVREATEQQEGLRQRSCTVCGYKQREKLDKLPHEHTFSPDWSKDEHDHWHAATCEHSDVVADKAAHTFGEWEVVREATTEQEGLQERSCTVCGYKQEESIAKLPHEHTFSPDWSKDEQNHWHAATCEHSDVVADKAAHTYGDWNVVREATEQQEGLRERSCTVCGATQQVTIEKLPTQTPQNDPQQPSAPQTGDNSRVALWAAVAVVTVAAFVVMIVYRKRR